MDQGAGAGLVVRLDGGLGLGEEGVGRDVADLLAVLGEGVGLRVQAARLPGRVVGADDQAGQRVAAVADPGDVPPGVGGVRRRGRPTEAPWTLPFGFAAVSALVRPGSWRTSWLAASEIASPTASGAIPSARAAATASAAFAGRRRRRLAQLLDPGVVRLPIARGAAQQPVLVEQPGQEGPQRVLARCTCGCSSPRPRRTGPTGGAGCGRAPCR